MTDHEAIKIISRMILDMEYPNGKYHDDFTKEEGLKHLALYRAKSALQEREERSKGCEFCGAKLYFKTTQYARPLLAPLTEVQALRDKLLDLTGEVYVEIDAGFCPMCGQRREDTK